MINQILPTFSYGDAIGNDVLALKKVLSELNEESYIYAENIDSRLSKEAKDYTKYKDGDVVIFHASIGSNVQEVFTKAKAKKWMVYHNITPYNFFVGYSPLYTRECRKGIGEIKNLKDVPDLCICDSNFNKQDLINMGYTCPIEVLPILIKFEDFEKEPNQEVIDKYSDGYTNIVFTGRVAPNKKHEDLIASFYEYKKYINPKSRLILVGSYGEEDLYMKHLKKYVEKLGIEDVIFTGHIPFADILAYYRVADVFLCLSEHEGFCVPLVEAMYFDVPIIAYDACAVGETLGGSGLLLKEKDPKTVAEAINLVVSNQELRETILENQRERLKDFSYNKVKQQFIEIINKYR